ncbi:MULTISPECIES: YlbD family protein [unclassified Bacillus (in: firmicutes)]|uniref:YlbD family protein n=1 Tax=unclassified Bacillus (in: firmicutes) TaxID=185979 RepID=UPI0008EC1ABA|nr:MULTISPECIES: YlbD family protein [unclassified Bacillus (in: firmicutes)]SFA75932.1 Putative coat protein [Bacillus sp. UNCCL13]SFQ65932.1 Putative coat protein [Bacillus sp. cl95]
MTTKNLHPSVLKFKEFVKANPLITQEVRKGNATWQELYEDWYLLGEEDSRWEAFRNVQKNEDVNVEVTSEETKSDWMGQMMGIVKNMDPNQVQSHLSNLSQAIGAVQGLLSQFQGSKQVNEVKKPDSPPNPFSFRKD